MLEKTWFEKLILKLFCKKTLVDIETLQGREKIFLDDLRIISCSGTEEAVKLVIGKYARHFLLHEGAPAKYYDNELLSLKYDKDADRLAIHTETPKCGVCKHEMKTIDAGDSNMVLCSNSVNHPYGFYPKKNYPLPADALSEWTKEHPSTKRCEKSCGSSQCDEYGCFNAKPSPDDNRDLTTGLHD